MNLYIRFFFHLIAAFFRGRVHNVLETTTLRFRVLPNDLDLNMHMNNGRYLTIMDIGRTDFVIRTGMFQKVIRAGQIPVLAAATIRFRVQLEPFREYALQTRIVCWDEKWAYMEQRFIITKGKKAGEIAAIAIVKGAFYDKKKKATVPTDKLLRAIGFEGEAPATPPHIRKWQESEELLRDEMKQA